jgi:alkanesulfonate monooxygenase SsuD/methylene tetrahydromethanopterin reductase-like flavin-dependent oxidoreductase (luciferase family)
MLSTASDLLFDTPWWLPTLLVLLAVGLFIAGNARIDKRLKSAAAAALLAAALLLLLSYFVETDKERMVRQTREMVAAVDRGDFPALKKYMAPGVTLTARFPNDQFTWTGRDELLDAAKQKAARVGLKQAVADTISADQEDTSITVTVEGHSIHDVGMTYPLYSVWRLNWQKFADGWMVQSIEARPSDRFGRQTGDKR